MTNRDVVVLFSGGTDSTLTAALVQADYRTVHLLTFDRLGFHGIGNTSLNARMLAERYGADRFRHETVHIGRLFKFIAYERYLQNLRKHGFHLLSTCGLCKLAMHMRTIRYCLEHGVRHATDGSNQGMSIFPAQMRPVLDEIRRMYDRFGIRYFTPVYEFDAPDEGDYLEQANRRFLEAGLHADRQPVEEVKESKRTPGRVLYEMGLAPAPDVKGTPYDRKRQARCFQLVLFNVFVLKWFLAAHSYEEYERATVRFFRDKIRRATEVLEANRQQGKYEKLFR